MGTRIRPDLQIMRAKGAGYVLVSDPNGELGYQLLSGLVGNGSGNGITDYVRDITNLSVVGNNLVIKYLDKTGVEQVKTVSLAPFAVDVKVDTATIVQQPEKNTYVLHLAQSDGTYIDVDLKALLAIVTTNTAEITLSGDGTPANPLFANLTPAVRDQIGGKWYTQEYVGLTNDSPMVLTLPRMPVAGSIRVYRNGLRQNGVDVWFGDKQDGTGDLRNIHFNYGFGVGVDSESVVIDYQSAA